MAPFAAKELQFRSKHIGIAILAVFCQATAMALGPTVTVSGPTPAVTQSGPVTFTVTYTDPSGNGVAGITLDVGNIVLCTTGTASGIIATSGTTNVIGMDYWIKALAVDASRNVYVGGCIKTAGGVSANGIARWDGTAWSGLASGVDGNVYAITLDRHGNVYAGGNIKTAGGVPANNIARWDHTSWSALGTGVDYVVYALAADASGNVYAGGSFKSAGGAPAWYVAKWNGVAWSAMGTGMNFPSKGRGPVYALVVDASGNLYAGGTFTNAGGMPANGIAKWDGTSWSALGSGTGIDGDDPPQLSVNALAVDASGNVYAGGRFKTMGGVSVNNIARWDGTTWSALGNGMANVNAIALDGSGNVYAADSDDVSANGIYKWDGNAWSPLGPVRLNRIAVLAVDAQGNMYAGGDFPRVGSVVVNKVAKWNGTAWSGMGNATGTGTVTVSNITGNGTLGIAIGPGSATDVAGNVAGPSAPSATCTVDNVSPSGTNSIDSGPTHTNSTTVTTQPTDPLAYKAAQAKEEQKVDEQAQTKEGRYRIIDITSVVLALCAVCTFICTFIGRRSVMRFVMRVYSFCLALVLPLCQKIRSSPVGAETEGGNVVNQRPRTEVGNMSPSGTKGKRFAAALSFPGEKRKYVEKVAEALASALGKEKVFYDRYYEAELARPDLDIYLQKLYRDDSQLLVIFLCKEYEKKEWCGLEWRAVRDLIKRRKDEAIMPFRFDDADVPGLFSIDGYIDAAKKTPKEAAELIIERFRRCAE